MGNVAARAGIKPILLASRTSLLTISSPRFPNVFTVSTPTCLCSPLSVRSAQRTTPMSQDNKYFKWFMFIAYNYVDTGMATYIHTHILTG